MLEAVLRLVMGKNYDTAIQHYWSCGIRSVVSQIWTAYPLLRRRVYACSYCPLVKLADSIPGVGYDVAGSPSQIAHSWSWLTRPPGVEYDVVPTPIMIAYQGC